MSDGVVTRFWFYRHAPVINPDRLVYGQSDIKADLNHPDAFETAAAHLPEDAVWVTTHLSRTQDTAAELARLRGLRIDPIEEPGLAEQHMGAWEMIPWEELQGNEVVKFWTDFARLQPPGGESYPDVIRRAGDALERILAAHAGKDIVMVLHGGSIRACLAHALALRPEASLAFHFDTLSLTRMEYIDQVSRPGWRVTLVNGGR